MRTRLVFTISIIGVILILVIVHPFLYKLAFRFQIYKLIIANSDIQSIEECWGWYGTGGDLRKPLALDVKMKDGKRLFLSYIYSPSLNAPFYLDLVGESTFFINYYSRKESSYKGSGVVHGIPIELIEQEEGITLNCVDDVVKNYDQIYNFIGTLCKLTTIGGRFNELKNAKPIEFTDENKRNEGYRYRWRIFNVEFSRLPDYHMFHYMNKASDRETRYLHRR
jgi:hypothetical protein